MVCRCADPEHFIEPPISLHHHSTVRTTSTEHQMTDGASLCPCRIQYLLLDWAYWTTIPWCEEVVELDYALFVYQSPFSFFCLVLSRCLSRSSSIVADAYLRNLATVRTCGGNRCTVYSVQCTVYSVQYSLVDDYLCSCVWMVCVNQFFHLSGST